MSHDCGVYETCLQFDPQGLYLTIEKNLIASKDLPGVRSRAFFKCPKGQLFDNDIDPPRCNNETVVKSCGKYVGPNTQLARQYIAYHTFTGPDDIMARDPLIPSYEPTFFEDYFEDEGEMQAQDIT